MIKTEIGKFGNDYTIFLPRTETRLAMTIEQQALALVNEVRAEEGRLPLGLDELIDTLSFAPLCRALKRHEADKAAWEAQRQAERQEVSEAVSELDAYLQSSLSGSRLAIMRCRELTERFIIAPPVDPLVEASREALEGMVTSNSPEMLADRLRAALAKHGLAITKEA